MFMFMFMFTFMCMHMDMAFMCMHMDMDMARAIGPPRNRDPPRRSRAGAGEGQQWCKAIVVCRVSEITSQVKSSLSILYISTMVCNICGGAALAPKAKAKEAPPGPKQCVA